MKVRLALAATALLATAACGGTSRTAAPAPTTSESASGSPSDSPSDSLSTAGSPSASTAAGPGPSSSTAPASSSPTAPASPAAALLPKSSADVVTGLQAPWGVTPLPDGSLLVPDRDAGTITRVRADGSTSKITSTGSDGAVPGVVHNGEGGLLGIAISPTFTSDGLLWAYTTTSSDNRVLRMQLTGDSLGAPTVVLSGITAASNHDGGRMAFGPDGKLYVTVGDANVKDAAQDTSKLNGKILRINGDGSIPADNPFGNAVWSYGHRNPQGIGWDSSGRMWAAEFGQNAYDELNIIVKGKNYGWPVVEGMGTAAQKQTYTDPLVVWKTSDASPSGIAVTDDAVYLAALGGKRLWRVPVSNGTVGTPQAFLTDKGRLRDVHVGPGNTLWVLTNNTDGRGSPVAGDDRLLRVTLG